MAIKLFIDHELDRSGKGKFLTRLVPELKKLGVKIVDFEQANLILGVNKFRKNVTRDKKRRIKDHKKRILRIDGIHTAKTKRNIWANRIVKEDSLRSKAIIWQSKFCRKMWKGAMKIRCKKEFVIFNGADPKDYENIEPAKSDYLKNIIMSSKFRSSPDRYYKRLRRMWEIAIHYNSIMSGNTCFWIAGETEGCHKHWPQDDRVIFLGHLKEKKLKPYLKMADVMMNLSWGSWCDNSLIEGICAGCIPISGNQGGNAEVTKACKGIVVDIDKEIKPKYVGFKPPKIEEQRVFEGIDQAFRLSPEINVEPIHIKNIAKQYKKVFEAVL